MCVGGGGGGGGENALPRKLKKQVNNSMILKHSFVFNGVIVIMGFDND